MTQSLDHIETLIFDFDGTVANTLRLGVKISNGLSTKYHYKKINNANELALYRSLPTQQALKAIGISLIKLPLVAAGFRKKLSLQIKELEPIKGISEVLRSLSKNYKIGIVTSNSKNNTMTFMEQHKLVDHVHYYSTGIGLFKKQANIKYLIKKNSLDPSKTLLIGDETRDIEAAKKCNLPIVSVSWGFHTTDILEEYKPDFMVHHPDELLQLLTR